MSVSKVFITGGAGFIGRNLIQHLVEQGASVKALSRSERSDVLLRDIGAEPVRGDMLDYEALCDGMKGCETLYHLAADTAHGLASQKQIMTNTQGTETVYRAAKAAGVKRALHLSSEAVLLTGKPLHNIGETTPIPNKAVGSYSASKAQAERIALSMNGDGFEVVVMRPRFVWGRDDTTALPQIVEAAQSGKLAWIDGGHYKTSTTHIDNVVHGMRLVMDKGRAGEVYFVTDGAPVDFRKFITDMLATRGVEAPTKSVPRALVAPVVRIGEILAKLTKGRLHGPMSWQEYATLGVEVTLDISKARRELGYMPVISIEDGMADLRQQSS